MILVYITTPNKKVARKIASILLENKLIACANIFPTESMYWWEGKIEKNKEFAIVGKTVKRNFNLIKKIVNEVHPYTLPCIIKINGIASQTFERWVKETVS